MKETNVRYGVVNEKERISYEKKNQVSFGYEFITTDKVKAIKICRRKNDSNCIVERIFDTEKAKNNKEEIYRSGKYEH